MFWNGRGGKVRGGKERRKRRIEIGRG